MYILDKVIGEAEVKFGCRTFPVSVEEAPLSMNATNTYKKITLFKPETQSKIILIKTKKKEKCWFTCVG